MAEDKGIKKGKVDGIEIGKVEGEKVGIEIGKVEGEKVGVEIGRMEEKIEMAKALKKKGILISLIAETSGLSLEEIKKL